MFTKNSILWTIFRVYDGDWAAFGDFLFVVATLIGLLVLGDIPSIIIHIMRYGGGGVLVVLGLWGLRYVKTIPRFDIVAGAFSVQEKIFFRVLKDFMTSFLMTVTNPLTLFGVVAAVTSVGLGGGLLLEGTFSLSLVFAVGIFLGSLSWWMFLACVGEIFLQKLDAKILYLIQYITSLAMIILGCGLILFGDKLF